MTDAERMRLITLHMPTAIFQHGIGVAGGWIEIIGSGAGGRFTDDELRGIKVLGLSHTDRYAIVAPHDLARQPGLEPGTSRLTAGRSTN